MTDKKQVRMFEVPFSFSWGRISIDNLKNDIKELEKLGATLIEVSSYEEYDCSYFNIKAYVNRLETDKEYNARIETENARQEKIKRMELKELQRLRLKYKNNL